MNHLDKIEVYYEKFVSLDEKNKKELLQKIASEEPEIYTQFVKIYESDKEASRYFQEIGDGLSSSFFDTGYEPGKVIGNYRLEQAIGAGGMAYVYKAERIDGAFQRSAAIKFIKRGIDTQEVIRRFHHERNILARLKHEHIAQLYDGGVSEDGLPYFVMEYIPGKDIISHCKENNLSLKQRLELFLQVCSAVDFAHKNLIIHRDIKPDNILIDENGKAKLTDFGIAKLLDDQEDSEQTQLQSRVMTKEYASPEQQNGDFITTTSDVYQLGVLLHELLAGQKAWNPTEKKHIFQYDKKLVPSELKSIIQTATRKEPEARYNSVEGLQQDVKNYLENKPVRAIGDSTWYLMRKFVKRNRVAVLISLAILATLTAGLVKYILDINEARLMADYKTVHANSMANLFVSSFARQYPTHANGDTLSAFDLLNSTETYFEEQPGSSLSDFDNFSKFRYNMLLGSIYSGWSRYDIALEKYHKAYQNLKKINDKKILNEFAIEPKSVYELIGSAHLYLGQTDSAMHYFIKSLNDDESNYHVFELSGIAYIHLIKNEYEKTDSVYNLLAIELSEENITEDKLMTHAVALGRLGSYYTRFHLDDKKNFIDSIFQKSLSIFEQRKIFSSTPAYKIFRKNKFKRNATYKGYKYKTYHPESHAEVLNYYGMFLYHNSDYDSALHYFQKSYEANLKYYGENNYKSMDNLNNIAAIQRNTGNVKLALQNLNKCWRMSQENKFIHPSQALNYYQNYASCFYFLGEYRACLQAMDTLLQLKAKYAPNDIYSINLAKVNMADCYYELGENTKALLLADQVIIDHQATFGEKGNTDLSARINKILYLASSGTLESAEKLYIDNKIAIEKRMGPADDLIEKNHQAYAYALLNNGRDEEAENLITTKLKGEISESNMYLYKSLLATCYLKSGRTEEGQKIYQELKAKPLANINAVMALQRLEELMEESI